MQRAVGLPEVDVDAAGLGHGRAELGEGHGAEEAEHAADDPDREHEERGGHGRGDLGRRQEDARADDAADDDHDDVPQAQDPRQGDLGLVDRTGQAWTFCSMRHISFEVSGACRGILTGAGKKGNHRPNPRFRSLINPHVWRMMDISYVPVLPLRERSLGRCHSRPACGTAS